MNQIRYCPLCSSKLVRFKCSQCGYIFWNNPVPTVCAIAVCDDQILLVKRAVEPFKNQWDFPGGFLEDKEHPEEALKREIKEELGVEIKIKNFFGIYMDKYFADYEKYTLNIYYEVQIKKEKLIPKDDIKEARFFNMNNKLPKLAFQNGRVVLEDVLNKYKMESQ